MVQSKPAATKSKPNPRRQRGAAAGAASQPPQSAAPEPNAAFALHQASGAEPLAMAGLLAKISSGMAAFSDLVLEVQQDGLLTGLCLGPRSLLPGAPETVAGHHYTELLPPSAHPVIAEALTSIFAGNQVENVICALELAQGTTLFGLSGRRLSPPQSGVEATALLQLRDVSLNPKISSEITRLRQVVQSMSNLVIFLDPQLCITWVNTAFEQHTGWRNAEIQGQDVRALVRSPESDPEVARLQDLAMAAHQPYRGQTINRDRHGKGYWVEFNVLPLFDAQGVLEGWVSIETDVSLIKAHEAQSEANAQAAAAAHRRLENAVNALSDAAVIFDADERLVVSNPAYAQYFPELASFAAPGISLQELHERGADVGYLDAPPAGPAREDWIAKCLHTYRQDHFATEIETADGRWLRLVNRRTADGGQICIAIDVSIRRRQIAALDAMNHELVSVLKERDEARRRLVSIMMGAEVGTWELDVPRQIMTVGGHWGQIIGRGADMPKTFPASVLLDLVHPDDRDALRQEHVYRGDYGARAFELEMRLRHLHGHWVWVMSRGQVLRRDDQGRPELIVGVHLDISDRKRLEREFEASQAHLGSAMESSVAGIALYDHEERLLYCNAEAHRILGLKIGMQGGNLDRELPWVLEALDGTLLEPREMPTRRARDGMETVRDLRVAARWPDGSRRVLACNAAPVVAGEGRVNVVLSFWDITEQLSSTEKLERALIHAEEMSRAKSVFLANMSHEIRTPLNGVLGLAEVLDMQISDPGQRRMIASIRRSGETLLSVLNSILDMSKIEAGKLQLKMTSFTMADVSAQILPVYAIQAEEKGLEFEVYRSAGCDQPRIGDPERIQQILHNLLSNAVKFTADGSITLDISCRPGKPMVFEVTDTGTGMTPEQAARVFDSFEQAEAGNTRRFGGAGLGLSIVRELVHMMAGTVAIDSTPGEGTTVKVVLPLSDLTAAPDSNLDAGRDAPAPPPPATVAAVPALSALSAAAEAATTAKGAAAVAAAAPAIKSPLAGLKVLGADDNVTNRDVLSGMLTQMGVIFSEAQDGRQAFELWQAAQTAGAPFDVVLLDIAMPVMDGPTTAGLIRDWEAAQGLPPSRIVAVSGQMVPESASYDHFDGHLMKPFSLKELREAVVKLL